MEKLRGIKWRKKALNIIYIINAIDLTYIQTAENLKKRKEEGKENNKIYLFFSIAFSIFIMVYISYNIIEKSYSPPREIDLQEIISPDSISVHKVTGDEYRDIMDFSFEDKDVMVSSSKETEKILQEIETKNLKNLSLIDNFNYERMEMDNSDQYTLWFNYPDLPGKKIRLGNDIYNI